MLTRNDRTVEDALDLLALIHPLGLRHIGFKDVGVSPGVLEKVAATIAEVGAVFRALDRPYLARIDATGDVASVARAVRETLARRLGQARTGTWRRSAARRHAAR